MPLYPSPTHPGGETIAPVSDVDALTVHMPAGYTHPAIQVRDDTNTQTFSVTGDGIITAGGLSLNALAVNNLYDGDGNVLWASVDAGAGIAALPLPADLTEQSAPASPSAGSLRVYAGTDHALHTLTSSGTDTALGSGGGGGNTTYTSAVASPPGSPSNGDQWWPSDGAGLRALRVSGAWQWYFNGYPIVLPVDSNYSWNNQRSTTKDTTDGTVYLAAPADSTDSISMRLKTVPSTPYTVIARLEFGLWGIGTSAAGLILRDSSSGNFSMFGLYGSAGSIFHHFLDTGGSGNNLSSAVLDTNGAVFPWPWWKITDDGTTRKYYVGLDGVHWLQHSSQGHTSPNTPTHIGFGLESRNATYPASLRVISWAEYASVI